MSNDITPVQALPELSIDNEDGHDYSPERYIAGLEARLKMACELLEQHLPDMQYHANAVVFLAKIKAEELI